MYPAERESHKRPSEKIVFGPRGSDSAVRWALDRFVEQADRAALVREDPVELVRAFADPHDQEVAGLLVAMLAYGRVASIKEKARRALEALGPHPARAIERGRLDGLLATFVHRFQRAEDVERFLAALGRVRKKHGTLGAAFLAGSRPDEPTYAEAMGRFVRVLAAEIEGPMTPGLRFLFPTTAGGGAAKRLCLYLRWMIRAEDGVDLGTWQRLAPGVDPARLIVPLDTHVGRIGRYVGLTDRASGDLKTAAEITGALRRFAPEDPLRYDLALCHLGISGRCPRRRDPVRCAGCPIRAVCRLGPKPRGWSS